MSVSTIRLKPEPGSQATVWSTRPSSRPLINFLCFQRGSSAHLTEWGGCIVTDFCLSIVIGRTPLLLLLLLLLFLSLRVAYSITLHIIMLAQRWNCGIACGVILVQSRIEKRMHLLRFVWCSSGPHANSGRVDLLTLIKSRLISYTSVPLLYLLNILQFGAT
jgi:hypothetical protein